MSVLRVENVGVRFGGVTALDDVELEADGGRVTGLIGPNGAGKTTLFNVITGLQPPVAGRIFLDGQNITAKKPHQRARMRIARTFQRLEVFGSLTVRENIMVAADARQSWSKDKEDPKRVTEEILDRVGLRSVAHSPVDALSTGLARLVELGRSMATRPRLLLLDEPGSGLDHSETEGLAKIVSELARDGMAVLLVEHDVELVMHVCAEIYVLDFGRLIACGTPTEIRADEAVRAAYLGTEDEAKDTTLAQVEAAVL